ncbi:hypothetical protein ACIBD9_08110 [Micromonospora sp. NPDC050784]|uniref:hypothetical protein n=1 Tax=Micromonospora sp. NPDC050784 TaxID=3364281 RepID=UPI00379D18B4
MAETLAVHQDELRRPRAPLRREGTADPDPVDQRCEQAAEQWRVVAGEPGDVLDERRSVVGTPRPADRLTLPDPPQDADIQCREPLLDLVDQGIHDAVELVGLPQLGIEVLLDVLRDDPLVLLAGVELLAEAGSRSIGHFSD